MSTKNLPALAELNRSLAPTFNSAASGDIRWKHERAFFEAQIAKNWQIARGIEKRIPATIESVKLAARECASMGISMSPVAQLVYFIPRRARKRRDGEAKSDYERTVPWLVTATPSYRGLSYIATHYAGASMVAGEVVYQADHFVYHGPIREPVHRPTLDNRERSEEKAIGAYAVVRMKDGHVRAEYVDAPTIYKIRELSEFRNGLMWTKVWTEGWKKVPIRRIAKTTMNSAPQMLAAVESMNRHEGIVLPMPGQDAPHSNEPGPTSTDDPDEPPPRPRGMNGLGAALDAEYHVVDDPVPEDDPPIEWQESRHPPGSIEWWADQIHAANDLERMDTIRAAALQDHVDRSDDADAFRGMYQKRCREIREGQS